MRINGEIIVIDDDAEDRFIIGEALAELNYPNKILFFEDPTLVIGFLKTNKIEPLIVFSDINMPKLNGLELRSKIVEELHLIRDTVPYIFFSTNSAAEIVSRAYDLSIQGYFEKPNDFTLLQNTLKQIIEYWKTAKLTN